MKIIDTRKSVEKCTESGWDAFDLIMDEPMDDSWIEKMRGIGGSFLYMKMLRKPFFKLESDLYVVKGIKGDEFFRVALHKDSIQEVDRIIKILNEEA